MASQHSLHPSALPEPAEYHNVTPDVFVREIEPAYKPAVLKGYAQHWPVVAEAKQSALMVADYLKNENSQQGVKHITLPEHGRMFYSDDMRGMNFSVDNTDISTAISAMLSPDQTRPSCIQSTDVKTHFPALLKSIDNPLVPQIPPHIWIGNALRVAPHFDEAHNIAVVVAGRRRFTLFPPGQIENLYVGQLEYTPAGQPISLVDINEPDLARFPRYEEAFRHGLSAELEPGDAIYIPTPWWHAVESLSPFNVLVNYWWSNRYLSSMLPFPMLMHTLQSLNSMPDSERDAWVAMLSYYMNNNSNNDTKFAHIPKASRGILDDPGQTTHRLIHRWLGSQL
ncbi:cupin-like domain-containing protein [Alteromonas halophila]|uniref:Cupin n=1 Tax=Alteromonas halophila TaxID=516698 RepID=A0A918JPQ0_9ALTE|nr:cupin-like domain-containing protein [Alteromonas halophila]GGW90980.1 cupin [Alteromonas halophila]